MPAHLRGGILALGNFDGFHRGHQAVVARAVNWARRQGRPAIVATFDPHPMRLFRPDAPPFRLTTLDQRERLFALAGAQAMLVEHLGAAGVVTGEDFTFGRGRSGDVDALRTLGRSLGLMSEAVAPVADASGEVVSSSRIRQALVAGDCATATRFLTRPFAIEGPVIHGDKRGREIGFPTANMELDRYVRPAYGIYAVRARLADGRVVDGAANLGVRPSFDPPRELLESYLFDFSDQLYGQTIEIALIERLRDEQKFGQIEDLIAQMRDDVGQARAVLAAR
jgi:riboflavin kinase/FMN adenylyltransferase